ncbi:MAG: DsrE family protein, partial [Alcanivorax sp.]|nr:DsrE family protein [Alcanivorax sp.]
LAWRGDGDQAGAAQQWQALVHDHEVDACVCVGAAQRRGICDHKLAGQRQRHGNLAAGFTLAGLGQWADAQRQSERVIQFG